MKRIFCLLTLILFLTLALAHDTKIVGPEGGTQYKVTVGMLNEPAFSEVRSGLDLIIRNAADDSPVANLENSLLADITAPTGETRTLTVSPQFGKPGYYKDDFILTEPGTYTIRIHGFIGDLAVDESYPREVGDVADLRFP